MGEMARLWGLRWIGDRTLRLALGHEVSPDVRRRVHRAFRRIRDAGIAGLVDVTPAYATIVMSFDPLGFDPGRVEEAIRASIEGEDPAGLEPDRLVEIPVCYDEDCAPDLGDVAAMHGMTPPDVVRLHASAEYVVHFLGFTPGFPYLGGLPDRLVTPRLVRPRVRVPAGSVGIAGAQTGIYPRATPGGWRLIGRTPLDLFDPRRDPPALLAMGDRVRFVPITHEEFTRAGGCRGVRTP